MFPLRYWIVGALAFGLAGMVWSWTDTAATARLVAFDVGQGDSLFVTTAEGHRILIDGGPDTAVLDRLGRTMPWFDRRLDLMILTHPDRDHLFGLPDVLRRYEVRTVLITGMEKNDARYREFLALIEAEGAHVLIADPAWDIRLGRSTVLDVVWPPPVWLGRTPDDPNSTSIVLRLITAHRTVLLTGDTDAAAERAMLRTGAALRGDILKVAHHGSRTSSSTGWLLATGARLAIVSAPRTSPFGHPHADVLERLRGLSMDVRQTGLTGDITIALR